MLLAIGVGIYVLVIVIISLFKGSCYEGLWTYGNSRVREITLMLFPE